MNVQNHGIKRAKRSRSTTRVDGSVAATPVQRADDGALPPPTHTHNHNQPPPLYLSSTRDSTRGVAPIAGATTLLAPPRTARPTSGAPHPPRNGSTRARRTFIGLFAAFAVLAAFAFTTGDRANAQSVVCSGGHWVVNGVGSYNPGANSGIPCDQSKPGWIFDGNNPGHIKWVYDGDRVATPYLDSSGNVRTAIREVQEQGNKRPPVNQPRATDTSAYLYQADRDNRAVRGANGQCYREQRIRGQWRRSDTYGATAEACRRAAWNAHFRAQGQPTVDPGGGTFPDGPAPKPLLQAETMGQPGATVDGLTLTLTFNQALDGDSVPAPGAFRVTENGARRSVATAGVAISGTTVTLTLTSAVRHGTTVRVSYTKPSTSPLRGANGFPVETFTNQAVTNNTPIWSATLTVAEVTAGATTYRGCFTSTRNTACSDLLTSSSFVSGGTTYTVGTLSLTMPSAEVALRLDRAISQDWTLHIGNQEFSVADATLSDTDKVATWTNAGFTWTANQTVQVRLTR